MYELPDVYKIGAIRMILCGEIREEIELKFSQISYEDMYTFIMDWAQMRRAEHAFQHGSDAMQIGGVDGQDYQGEEEHDEGWQEDQGQGDEWAEWQQWDGGVVLRSEG